ncbi:MBL fold metallo-hydrolase [Paenibacillus jamilae]|uniref:MBL fold metallo-hydrolase n=1 Tax=Paenibacillus jamilae TaxID=114136 RepID=UPI003D2CC998
MMMTKLRIWGGAGEHGRSCYVFEGKQHRIMLDCGVKKEGTGQYPVFPPQKAKELTTVLLSHAHEDHSMGLPLLYKYGYRGEVWTTKATAEQLGSYFRSWHTYVESRGGELPYGEEDIQSITYRYLEDEVPSGVWHEACPGVRIMWGRSGHLAGAVWYIIEMEGKRLFFSGDYSRESELLAADAPGLCIGEGIDALPECKPKSSLVDISIMDNAYGMDIDPQPVKLERLRVEMEQTLLSGGHVLLPVPAFGRGQELIVWVSEQFPEQAIIVEPDLWHGLKQLIEWKEWLRLEAPARILHVLNSSRVFVPRDVAERISLLERNRATIIVTRDGMMDSPQARWYYQYLSDTRNMMNAMDRRVNMKNSVMLTGHASNGSFGKQLLERADSNDICIARHLIYKVHQGLLDVRRMLKEMPSKQVVLVHAPKLQTDLVRDELIKEGNNRHGGPAREVHSLEPGTMIEV